MVGHNCNIHVLDSSAATLAEQEVRYLFYDEYEDQTRITLLTNTADQCIN